MLIHQLPRRFLKNRHQPLPLPRGTFSVPRASATDFDPDFEPRLNLASAFMSLMLYDKGQRICRCSHGLPRHRLQDHPDLDLATNRAVHALNRSLHLSPTLCGDIRAAAAAVAAGTASMEGRRPARFWAAQGTTSADGAYPNSLQASTSGRAKLPPERTGPRVRFPHGSTAPSYSWSHIRSRCRSPGR